MNTKRYLLILTLWMGIALSGWGQRSGRGPVATSTVGHMAVTLLAPATVTASQNLEFKDISLRSSEASSSEASYNITMASIQVLGNQSTYSVSVNNKNIGFSHKGKALSIGQFSAVPQSETTGDHTIYIGATMSVQKRTVLAEQDNNSPLTVTINYN